MNPRIPSRLLLLLAAGLACTPPAPSADCLDGPGVPVGPVTARAVDDGIRVVGFDGALGEATAVTAGDASTEASPDDHGRFDVTLADEGVSFIELGGERVAVRRAEAGGCVPSGERLEAGTVPNDVALLRCDGELRFAVAASADGAVHLFGRDGFDRQRLDFTVADGTGASPWHVAPAGENLAISLYGQHTVTVANGCTGRRVADGEPVEAEGRQLVLVDVTPAAFLELPIDADGDGLLEREITSMRLLHPQGVAIVDDVVLATFTNLLEVGPPAQYGPGVVFRWRLGAAQELQPLGVTVLPFQNPQAIALDALGRPWVSASGVLDLDSDGVFAATTDGGLLRVNPETGDVEEQIDLDRFAPATPAFTPDHAVVGSLVSPAMLVIDLASPDAPQRVDLGDDRLESLFEAAALPGGLVVVTEFGTDLLHVLDPRGPTLHPWPFTAPIQLGAGELARGAQAIALAPPGGEGGDLVDGAVLLGLSSEVLPLRFWQEVGP